MTIRQIITVKCLEAVFCVFGRKRNGGRKASRCAGSCPGDLGEYDFPAAEQSPLLVGGLRSPERYLITRA